MRASALLGLEDDQCGYVGYLGSGQREIYMAVVSGLIVSCKLEGNW
jgi:hypothetical protein